MELLTHEIYDRATKAPGTKAKLAKQTGETKASITRKCRRPLRVSDPCATGRSNEIEKIERTLEGLVLIGKPTEADFIVNRLRCFVQECKQESGPEPVDIFPLLLQALESLVRAMRIRMDGPQKDFEEAALRSMAAIEDCILSGRGQL